MNIKQIEKEIREKFIKGDKISLCELVLLKYSTDRFFNRLIGSLVLGCVCVYFLIKWW